MVDKTLDVCEGPKNQNYRPKTGPLKIDRHCELRVVDDKALDCMKIRTFWKAKANDDKKKV